MLRRRHITPFALCAFALVFLSACGEDYDPCWVGPEIVEELFSTTTVSQSINTSDPVTTTTGFTVSAEAGDGDGDTHMCAYTLEPERQNAHTEHIVLHRGNEVDEELFAQHLAEAEAYNDHRVFAEEYRGTTIVYSIDTARAIVGDHYYWARYNSNASLRADRGSDIQPLMRYIVGTNGGHDVEGYHAWLADEAEREAEAAEEAAVLQAEQDYDDGYAAGVEDGEYEALYGHPPQHYHRDLASRSEDWVSGFEQGKSEGLASGATLADGDAEQLMGWDADGEEDFSDPHGPFSHLEGSDTGLSADVEEVFDEGLSAGLRIGAEDGSQWGQWLPNAALYSLHYAGTEERDVFNAGFVEGYGEGFVQGWQDAGKPLEDLPAEARP